MKRFGWGGPLVSASAAGLLLGALISTAADSAPADPASATAQAITPTPVNLPPPGPRPGGGANGVTTTIGRPRIIAVTNGEARFTPTNTSPPRIVAPVTPKALPPGDRFRRANVDEFDQLRADPNAVVVDVRTADEFATGHLPKAGLLDVKSADFMATVAGLDRSKMYLVNCAAGVRSVRACQNFAALGFTNVVNLDGGFTAWLKAKPNVVSVEPAVALPKALTPNMEQSGTAATPPPAKPGSTNKNPVFNAPYIIKKPAPSPTAK